MARTSGRKNERDEEQEEQESKESKESKDEASAESEEREESGDEQSEDEQSGDEPSDEESEDEDSDDDDSDESDDDSDDDDSDDEGREASPSISAKEMTQAAMETLRDLTGRDPEAATGLQWDGESWLVTIDVLELNRIPETTDLMATYVVQLDDDGNLRGYKRTRRFQRGQAEEE